MMVFLLFLGALAAILLLAWAVRAMKMGEPERIGNADEARALAEEVMPGFSAQEVALDRAGYGALLRDDSGRVMVLRQHGAHYAGRLLEDTGGVRLDQSRLTVATNDRRFGQVTLDLGPEAQVWAASLRHLAR